MVNMRHLQEQLSSRSRTIRALVFFLCRIFPGVVLIDWTASLARVYCLPEPYRQISLRQMNSRPRDGGDSRLQDISLTLRCPPVYAGDPVHCFSKKERAFVQLE